MDKNAQKDGPKNKENSEVISHLYLPDKPVFFSSNCSSEIDVEHIFSAPHPLQFH